MLEVHDLFSGYGRLQVLNGIDFRADASSITAIIGPNGSGKSTLLKSITGFLRPTKGSVEFDGISLVGLRPESVLRMGLLYVQQGRSVFPFLTVEDNLRMGAYVLSGEDRTRAALDCAYAAFPRLRDRRRQLAGSLSGGERRFLELARALMLEPRMVLLDEPSLGVAPRVMAEMYARIAELHASGIGFVIVEQNVRLALAAAEHVCVLELGRDRWSGSPQDLTATGDLRELYLGGRA